MFENLRTLINEIKEALGRGAGKPVQPCYYCQGPTIIDGPPGSIARRCFRNCPESVARRKRLGRSVDKPQDMTVRVKVEVDKKSLAQAQEDVAAISRSVKQPHIVWKKYLDGDTLEERITRMLRNRKTDEDIVGHVLIFAPKYADEKTPFDQKTLENRIRKTLRYVKLVERNRKARI
jgi:hypothetical protein